MSSIGETLRRERVRRNLGLDQISRELKISARFLEAIEQERFDRLPAGVFAKSFVRQYARYLDLDEDEIAGELQHVFEPPAPPTDSTAPQVPPIPDIHVPRVDQWETVSDRSRFDWSSSLPSLALVVVVMLVCSGIYAFWQHARRPIPTAQTTPPPFESAPVPQPQQPSVPQPEPQRQAEAAPPAVAQPAPAEAPPAAAQQQAAAPAPRAQTDSADRIPEAGAPKTNAPVRVQLTADEPVWVLARADGKYLFSGTLEANETRSVEANGTLLLRFGNAGGVTVTLNGKPLGVLGPKGQVRDVQFTSGGFQIVAAPKPPSLPNPI
jgi:cytoskeleton protein RodZ